MQAEATEVAKKALAVRLITNELMLGTAGEWRISKSGKKYWWHEYQGSSNSGSGKVVNPPVGSGSGVGDATAQATSGGSSKEIKVEEKIVEAVKTKGAASKKPTANTVDEAVKAEQQRAQERTAPRKVSEVMTKTNPNKAKLAKPSYVPRGIKDTPKARKAWSDLFK
jgi:hypothetical protein